MNTSIEHIKGQELLNILIKKSWEDNNFKERLKNNPTEVIKEVTGKEVSLVNNNSIVVEDQTDTNTIFLNIPRPMNSDNMELTDEQLELVSGGEFAISLGAACLIAGCILLGGIAVGYIAGEIAQR